MSSGEAVVTFLRSSGGGSETCFIAITSGDSPS
jgi:hypothetical protein